MRLLVLKGQALPRVHHPGEIVPVDSCRLRSSFAAAPVLSAHALAREHVEETCPHFVRYVVQLMCVDAAQAWLSCVYRASRTYQHQQ